MSDRTLGQVAHEAMLRLDDGPWSSWGELDDEGRAIWEAVAQAVADEQAERRADAEERNWARIDRQRAERDQLRDRLAAQEAPDGAA